MEAAMLNRPGDWFFIGAIATLLAQEQSHLGRGYTVVAALCVGFFLNEWAKKNDA